LWENKPGEFECAVVGYYIFLHLFATNYHTVNIEKDIDCSYYKTIVADIYEVM